MVLEAIKNASTTYQQGSTTGKDVKVAEKAQATMEKAGPVLASEAENVQVKERERNNNGGQKEYSVGNQDTADKQAAADLPKGNEAMRKAVEEINKNAKSSEAIFGIHDATNRVTIKIVDKDSRKVLKEYPPEKTLDMIAKVWEMAGLMVDEKM